MNTQRGAALLVALILVVLIAAMASSMVWRQQQAIQIEAAARARTQSAWILGGALDWARLILREDARNDQQRPPAVDHLGEVWAVPLAEARLSTFLAAEPGQAAEDGPDAFLAGAIEDAQARYNLRNLAQSGPAGLAEARAFARLCERIGLPADLAPRLTAQIQAALPQRAAPAAASPAGTPPGPRPAPTPAEPPPSDGPLPPGTLDQLSWLGLPEDALARLRRVAIWLPQPTPVNVNTAPREVLAAVIDGLDLASAERLVQARAQAPFNSLAQAQSRLPAGLPLPAERLAVASQFFIVSGRLRLDERVLEERSLIERRGLDMQVRRRERVSHVLAP